MMQNLPGRDTKKKEGGAADIPLRYSVRFVSGYWHFGVEWGGVLNITKRIASSNFGTQSSTL